jgi:hypothetical protein
LEQVEMSPQRLIKPILASAFVALTLTTACQSQATTVKFVRELALGFSPLESKLSPSHEERLRALWSVVSAQCLAPSSGSVVVAIEALLVEPPTAQNRALAEARAREVKSGLVSVGFAESAVYGGVTPHGQMVTRKAAGSALTKQELGRDTVVVELVCDPAQ